MSHDFPPLMFIAQRRLSTEVLLRMEREVSEALRAGRTPVIEAVDLTVYQLIAGQWCFLDGSSAIRRPTTLAERSERRAALPVGPDARDRTAALPAPSAPAPGGG